jgi:alpha-ketoglutarate-dependent 2,4-dichlorophenoxyacetate dioxygenase
MATFRQVAPTFVAEVNGVDFTKPITKDTIDEIRDGIDKYGVLVFRNANIDDDTQIAFASSFGELEPTPAGKLGKKLRLPSKFMFDLSNIDHNDEVTGTDIQAATFSKGNEIWHADMQYHPRRTKYSILRAVELPPKGTGGETLYADSRAAYDDLSDEMKEKIEGVVANCSLLHNRRTAAPELYRGVNVFDWPVSRWKLVYPHERTGRRNLYVTTYAYTLDDLTYEDSQKIIQPLLEHVTQDKYVCKVEWENAGDMVMWDNTAVLHRATDSSAYRHKYRRDVRRTSAWDDGPHAWGENDPNDPWVISLPKDPYAEPSKG